MMSYPSRDGQGAAQKASPSPTLERWAAWLSAACAVHCLVMPAAAMALPLMGASSASVLGGVLGGAFEHVLSVLVVVGGVASALFGYRRHGSMRLTSAMLGCVVLYLAGHALEAHWYGSVLAIGGGLGLAASSFLSARRGHVHDDAHCAH